MPGKQPSARMVPFDFPTGGLNIEAGFNDQPKSTTRDALNIVPFEPTSSSGRGGQRSGLSKCCDGGLGASIGSGMPVTGLLQATLSSIPGPGLVGGTPDALIHQYGIYGISDTAAHNFNGLAEAANEWHVWESSVANPSFFDLANGVTGAHDTGGLIEFYNNAHSIPTVAGQGNPTALIPNETLIRSSQAKSFAAVGFPNTDLDSTYKNYVFTINAFIGLPQASTSANWPVIWMGLHFNDTFGTSAGNVMAKLTTSATQGLQLSWYLNGVLQRTETLTQPGTIGPGPFGGIGSAVFTPFSNTGISLSLFKIDNGDGTWSHFLFASDLGETGSGGTPTIFSAKKSNGLLSVFTHTPTVLTLNHVPVFGVTNCTGTTTDGFVRVWNQSLKSAIPGLSLSIPVPRNVQVVAVAGGNVFQGDINTMLFEATTAALSPYVLTQMDDGQGKVIMVDGTNTKIHDLATRVTSNLTATVSKGTVPAGCRLVRIWRDRLILANQLNFEQNIYMSRAGDYHDWLYGQDDALTAIALNDSPITGRIGDPVTALIAATDDVLLISTDHSLFACVGDPGANGTITVISSSVGVVGANAWTVDPLGTIYFVGNAGFYAYQPGHGGQAAYAEPKNLAEGKVAPLFAAIDRSTTAVTCCWDRDHYGCWIFFTPLDRVSQGFALWFDERTGSFWKMQYPLACGPYSAFVYDGDSPVDRAIIVGGTDGFVRKIDPSAKNDDGTAITSYCNFGPLRLADPFNQAMVIAMETVLGQAGSIDATWSLTVGDDAETAFDANAISSGTFVTGGRQPRVLTRARGNTAYLKIGNSNANFSLAFERGALATLPGGPLR